MRLIVCLLLVSLTGCAYSGTPEQIRAAQISDVRDFTQVAVLGYVGLEEDKAEQTKRAKRISEIAEQVKVSATIDFNSPQALVKIATALIAKSVDEDRRVAAETLLSIIGGRIQRALGIEESAEIPAEQLSQAQALVIAACDGAIETSKRYLK